MSAAAREKNKTKQKTIWYSCTGKETPVATDRMKSGALWSATNNAEQFIVHTQPLPQWFETNCCQRSERLMESSGRLREKHQQVYCP